MLSVRLDEESDSYLRNLATQEDRTVNNLIKRIIKDYASRNPLDVDAPQMHMLRDSKAHKWRLVAEGIDLGILTLDANGGLVLSLDINQLKQDSPCP